MAVQEVGHAALHRWREEIAERVAPAVGKRTPLAEDWIRTALGLLFLALAVRYIARTLAGTRG
ncbi:MAG: hypothetical protein ABR583_08150 [Gaiellaceae bacterium]